MRLMRYSSPDRKARPPPPFRTWIYQLKGVFLFCSRMCCAYFFPMIIYTLELKKKRKKTKFQYIYIMNKVYIHSKGAGEGDKIWKRDQKATAAIADSLLLKKSARPLSCCRRRCRCTFSFWMGIMTNYGAPCERGEKVFFFFFQPTRRNKEEKKMRENDKTN